jgi:uncharacterized protein YvpB
MDSTPTLCGDPGEQTTNLSQNIASFFSVPVLIGLNLIILSGFISFLIFNHQPEPAPVLAAVPHTSAAQNTRKTPTLTPEPSRTPFNYFPPSATAIAKLPPTETPTPTSPLPLPAETTIEGMVGHRQSMPLSCEARSAVDWAAYFGKSINEYTFFNGLPIHDNPDKGFVGSVYGSWGQTPPNDYGVHAKPIAQRLREFGLQAKYVRDMTWGDLKAEIAAGRPVIVWVVGHVGQGTAVPYTTSGGAQTIVAKFEHTVIAIGYTENKIIVLDGARVYSKYKGEFLKSWGVLENQAVIWID